MQTSLHLDIDPQKTAKRVADFLDKKLDHYLALSGKRRFDLQSPSMDGMPKPASHGNSSEDRMLNIWLAENVVECVGLAMRNMTRDSQQVMTKRYSDSMTVYNIASELNYSASTYTRGREKALCEFADRFEYQVVRHGIENEVRDLHVYER